MCIFLTKTAVKTTVLLPVYNQPRKTTYYRCLVLLSTSKLLTVLAASIVHNSNLNNRYVDYFLGFVPARLSSNNEYTITITLLVKDIYRLLTIVIY